MGVASRTSLSEEDSAKESRELFVEIDSEEIKMAEARELVSVHLQCYGGQATNCREREKMHKSSEHCSYVPTLLVAACVARYEEDGEPTQS